MDIATLQSSMRTAFRIEAADLLAELDSSMLELESRPQDADLLNRVFRAIHTIKGSGATAGFTEMAAFTHHVEELFDEARMGRLTITPEMIDVALRAKDLIGQLMESEQAGAYESECSGVVGALSGFLPHKARAPLPARPKAHGGADAGAPRSQRYRIYFKPHAEIFFSGTDPANLVDELGTLGQTQVTARVEGVPPLDSLNPEQCHLAWEVELVSSHSLDKIKEVFLFVEDESEIRIECEEDIASSKSALADAVAAFRNVAEQSQEAIGGFLTRLRDDPLPEFGLCENYLRILKTYRAAASHQRRDGTVTILDEQIRLLEVPREGTGRFSDEAVGRLADLHRRVTMGDDPVDQGDGLEVKAPEPIAVSASTAVEKGGVASTDGSTKDTSKSASTIRVDQDKLDRLMRAVGELLVARNALPVLAKKLSLDHGLSVVGKEVKDAGAHISRIAEDLQAAVMSIRMMPIRTVFQRFPRLARDICRAQGKEAELILEGEATELDKTVIEQIVDPLVHLVRNALDHGIEPPEDRERAGKPRTGKVRLRAFNQGNNVIIEVHDDGKGMDAERIKLKAVEKGLITAAVAATLSQSAALDLVFLPGLTTAETLTDISGRGVGMDVVRSNVQKVHGTITLESQRGRGSRIAITLPTSLMVSKGILVESNGEEYILPMESVSEMVRLPRRRIHRHEQQYFASVRDQVFPVLRLADHFRSERGRGPTEWPEEVSLAILETGRGRVGVAVDRFVSQVEAIVKPMGRDLTNLREFRGATIMGDGRVVLVINPSGLV